MGTKWGRDQNRRGPNEEGTYGGGDQKRRGPNQGRPKEGGPLMRGPKEGGPKAWQPAVTGMVRQSKRLKFKSKDKTQINTFKYVIWW